MVEKGYFDDETGLPRAAAVREGVDPRLDNRTGDQRPAVFTDPAVPQQVDGPDVLHQAEHAEAVQALAQERGVGDSAGMFSPGDHSVSDYEARGGNHAGQADDVLETDPESSASASTDARKGEVAARSGAASRATETATAAPGERRQRSRAEARDAGEGTGAKADAKDANAKDADKSAAKDAGKDRS